MCNSKFARKNMEKMFYTIWTRLTLRRPYNITPKMWYSLFSHFWTFWASAWLNLLALESGLTTSLCSCSKLVTLFGTLEHPIDKCKIGVPSKNKRKNPPRSSVTMEYKVRNLKSPRSHRNTLSLATSSKSNKTRSSLPTVCCLSQETSLWCKVTSLETSKK